MLAIMAVLLVSGTQLMARGSGQTAFELNEAARSCMWNDMDSAERYARFALDISPRHSDEHARAVNTLARLAFLRMDYTEAWKLYSSVTDIT